MMKRHCVVGMLLISCTMGCASRPTIKSVASRILDVDLRGVDLAFDVLVENPLPLPLKSTGGRYGIDIAGERFLSWDRVPGINVPAGSVGKITLPARVEYRQLIKTISTMAKAQEVPYRLHGALTFPELGSRFDLPFKYEGTMPGPAKAVRGGVEGLLRSQ